jgi:hypothetical protein
MHPHDDLFANTVGSVVVSPNGFLKTDHEDMELDFCSQFSAELDETIAIRLVDVGVSHDDVDLIVKENLLDLVVSTYRNQLLAVSMFETQLKSDVVSTNDNRSCSGSLFPRPSRLT